MILDAVQELGAGLAEVVRGFLIGTTFNALMRGEVDAKVVFASQAERIINGREAGKTLQAFLRKIVARVAGLAQQVLVQDDVTLTRNTLGEVLGWFFGGSARNADVLRGNAPGAAEGALAVVELEAVFALIARCCLLEVHLTFIASSAGVVLLAEVAVEGGGVELEVARTVLA